MRKEFVYGITDNRFGRLINRFLETGRYIKPELVTRYGSGISNAFEAAKKATELVDGFSKWNNDVPLGCRPKLVEFSHSCKDMVQSFSSTLRDRLEQAESNCKILRGKIDEVNNVFRNNPELSKQYVKRRDELRGRTSLANKLPPQSVPKHKGRK